MSNDETLPPDTPEITTPPVSLYLYQIPGKTPEVDFKYVNDTISIIGDCDPDGAGEYFKPILGWLEKFATWEEGKKLRLIIATEYIGSTSVKYFREIFRVIEKISKSKEVKVEWTTSKSNARVIGYAGTFADNFNSKVFEIIPKDG